MFVQWATSFSFCPKPSFWPFTFPSLFPAPQFALFTSLWSYDTSSAPETPLFEIIFFMSTLRLSIVVDSHQTTPRLDTLLVASVPRLTLNLNYLQTIKHQHPHMGYLDPKNITRSSGEGMYESTVPSYNQRALLNSDL